MADRLPLQSTPGEHLDDPFGDNAHQYNESELLRAPRSGPSPYGSSVTLASDHTYPMHDDDEYVEQQPLNAGGTGFSGGFYPPQ